MWEEMFVTSSVRLIVPVGRLFVPEYGGESGMVLRTLWTHGGGAQGGREPVWRRLYRELLRHNLYTEE